MAEQLQEYWILWVIGLVVALLVAWWLFAASRRTRVELDRSEPGDAPAKRNQALIDAPPASKAPPPPIAVVDGLGGIGEAVAATIVPQAMPSVPVPAAVTAQPAEEPAAVTAQPAEGPAAVTAQPAGEPTGGIDDLTRIKGLGPKLADQLRQLGVTSLSQIAAWSDADIDRIDAQLGRFQGRIRRDDWTGQARLLAAGDTQGYESKFGKI